LEDHNGAKLGQKEIRLDNSFKMDEGEEEKGSSEEE
jgi:hypothetical protein